MLLNSTEYFVGFLFVYPKLRDKNHRQNEALICLFSMSLHSLSLFALLAEVNASSSSYFGKEKLSSIVTSHRTAMEEGSKVSKELKSQ